MILCTHDTIGAALSRSDPDTLEHDLLTQMHEDTRESGGGLFLPCDFASLDDFLAVYAALHGRMPAMPKPTRHAFVHEFEADYGELHDATGAIIGGWFETGTWLRRNAWGDAIPFRSIRAALDDGSEWYGRCERAPGAHVTLFFSSA